MTPPENHHGRDGQTARQRVPMLERHDRINPDQISLPAGNRSARQAFIHSRVTCLMAMWRIKQRRGPEV